MRTKPLEEELGRIEAMKDRQDVLNEIGHLHSIGINAFFNFGAGQDSKDSTRDIAQAVQGGLGMPDRDYYSNPEAGVAKTRTEYVAHLQNMLKLLGSDDKTAAASATKIMEFETALAKVSRKLEDLRDPQKNYNKMTLAEVRQKHTPSIAWDDHLAAWNLHPPFAVVGQASLLARRPELGSPHDPCQGTVRRPGQGVDGRRRTVQHPDRFQGGWLQRRGQSLFQPFEPFQNTVELVGGGRLGAGGLRALARPLSLDVGLLFGQFIKCALLPDVQFP